MNDRARMPFALVGVLVLVSSTTLAATVVTHDPSTTPSVDRAMAGAEAETVTALRTAADEAATETAANPVTVPATTTAGRALDTDQPFRDALRLRLYLLAQERLESVVVRRGGVVANASLPSVPDSTEGYRTAIDRVTVERAGDDGTALRVAIRGIRLTGVHQGRRVASEELSPTFVVANPALFMHDRTARFETRVNASVAHPGLAQRITTRLYPIAWARGYAQYSGVPIANVLGTRHVELVTNDALVAEQRTVFGTADPAAERGVVAAGARVAGTDLLAASGVSRAWTREVLSAAEDRTTDTTSATPVGTRHEPPEDTSVTVGVNASADRAFAETLGLDGDDDLGRAIERAHTVQARIRTDVSSRRIRRETPENPGGSWSFTGVRRSQTVSLRRIEGRPPRAEGWHTRDGASFRALETVTITRTWRSDGETRTTRTVVERTYRIHVAVQARTAPVPGARQGNLEGHLAPATQRAVDRATDAAGGYEAVARAAVDGTTPDTMVNETADSTVDRDALVRDLRGLRERTRAYTTTVSARNVTTGRANPPRRLLETVTASHEELRGSADRTVEERSRVAVREAYLTNLEARLSDRTETQRKVNEGIADEIGDHVNGDRLDAALSVPRNPLHPPRRSWTDPAGNLSLDVETGPSYLPTGPVARDRIGARGGGEVYPLKTRNLNLFTSPHGQVVDAIFDRLPFIGDGTVSLATAAQVLARLNESDEGYDELEDEVATANDHVRDQLVAAMVAAGVTESDARAALATDASTAETALEFSNGTASERAIRRATGENVDRDRLRVRLALTRRRALADDTARPPLEETNAAADLVRREFRTRLEERATRQANAQLRKTKMGKKMARLPAGVPLIPGYWYATGNVWYVEVAGTYERFVVRANRSDGRAATTYIREARTASLEHDGRRLRLGRDERISFRTETVVVVVVPPGPTGVGDTDGVADERSPGWPPEKDPSAGR